MAPPPLHPQLTKHCLNCLENRRGAPKVKDIVEYRNERGTRSHVRLCPHCDAPSVVTIYDLDPQRVMP